VRVRFPLNHAPISGRVERRDGRPKAPCSNGEWRRDQLLHVLSDYPGISLRGLAKETGMATSTVKYNVNVMLGTGQIRNQATTKGTHQLYFVQAEPQNAGQ